MQMENEFGVPAAPDRVFAALMDVRAAATCLPGATVGGETEDGAMSAAVTVRVGPVRLTYAGTVRVEERDDEAHTATYRVAAHEQRGGGTADATVHLTVRPDPGGGSRAAMATDLVVTGRLVQMGAGIVQEMLNSMVAEFADCLDARLTAEGGEASASPPHAHAGDDVHALPLLIRAMQSQLRHLLHRE